MEVYEGLTVEQKIYVLDMLDGCICRICVSDEPLEIVRMMSTANQYLAQLACDSLVRIFQRSDSNMKDSKSSTFRAKKIAQGKVNYVILDGNTEVYLTKNFFEAIQALDVFQRQNPQKEYKFTITEVK